MEDYQIRVVEEKRELDAKLEKLNVFLGTDLCKKLDLAEIINLSRQSVAMEMYSKVLEERIKHFAP